MTMAPEAPPPVEQKRSLPAMVRRRLAPIEERLDGNTALAFGIVTIVAGLLRFVPYIGAVLSAAVFVGIVGFLVQARRH